LWDGCVARGSFRVQCPRGYYPCNQLKADGKVFNCDTSCQEYGGKRNCSGHKHDNIEPLGQESDCIGEPRDDDKLLCADGKTGSLWDGCVARGSFRVQCPRGYYPCNQLKANGKVFHCDTSCQEYGGKRNCSCTVGACGLFNLNASCDNILRVYLDGVLAFGPETDLYKAHTVPVPTSTRVIGISCYDQGGGYGIVASADNGRIVTDDSWSCSSKELSGWATIGFDDKGGDFLTPSRGNIYNQGSHSSYAAEPPVGIDQNAHSLWGPTEHGWAFCRKILEAIQQTSTTPAPVMTNIAGCIDGWSAFGSNCYKYFEASLPWQNAENQCKLEGGHLASIHSKEENDFIKSITTPKWFWIGLTDFTEGVWVWSDGSPFSFSNWLGSGPSNSGGNEDCTHGTQDEAGNWNDVNCVTASVLGFVCKT